MARASKITSIKWKLLPSALNAWFLCVALPALAQQGTIVSGEAHGVASHENKQLFETIFPILNYLSGFAVAGAVIFGGIWMLQRKSREEAEQAEAAKEAASTEASKETVTADVSTASTTDVGTVQSTTDGAIVAEKVSEEPKTEEAK
jgi:hypothetical protein